MSAARKLRRRQAQASEGTIGKKKPKKYWHKGMRYLRNTKKRKGKIG